MRIYLSPSTQEYNEYVTGGTEEYYMNLVTDAAVPYLTASGVQYTRNTPAMTAASSIRQANSGVYDFYLALHSNAAPEGKYGSERGCIIYYYTYGRNSARAAGIFTEIFKGIYPEPARVRAVPTTTIGEVSKTKAPAVLIEIAYHDNRQDADWITRNIPAIGRAAALGVTRYLSVPLVEPRAPMRGTVTLSYGRLNIRARPSVSAQILTAVPNGTVLTVLGESGGWYTVSWRGVTGFAAARYISL